MDLPETTLNTQEAIDASSASADRPAFDPDSIGLINTVSDGTDVPAKTAGKQEDTTDKSLKTDGDAEPEKGTAKEQGSMRFDQHPDWQRMMRERDEARQEAQRIKEERIRLEAERDFLLEQRRQPAQEEPLPYKDTSRMSAEDLAEWMTTDPKGYHDNLVIQAREQAKREVRMALEQSEQRRLQESREASIRRTYEKYEKENPDFKAMWDRGEIQVFLEANPGHNPISAHQMMTMEARVKAAAEKAAKEAAERTNKNWQAKRQAAVIGTGPSGVGNTADADNELQNTRERGGPVSVLVHRLQKLRAAAGR